MKATVDAKSFYEAMKKVRGVLKRSAIPALEQIRVDFANGVCRLSATDLTAWLTVEIPAAGDDFSFLFAHTDNAFRACRYFSGQMTAELSGSEGDRKVVLSADGKNGEFPVENVDMCPECPVVEAEQRYFLDAPALLERIKKVRYASCVDERRPSLDAVRFDGKHVWCVDGMRMAVNDDEGLRVERSFMLPSHALAHLKVFGSDKTELAVGKRYAAFTAPGTKLLIRKTAEPDRLRVEEVVPQSFAESYSVERNLLKDAILYLDGCSRGMAQPYAFFDGDKLSVKNGAAEYSVSLCTIGPTTVQYAFDIRYMKEALEQFSGEERVCISVSGKSAPILLRADGTDMAMMLPVRMRNSERWNSAA